MPEHGINPMHANDVAKVLPRSVYPEELWRLRGDRKMSRSTIKTGCARPTRHKKART